MSLSKLVKVDLVPGSPRRGGRVPVQRESGRSGLPAWLGRESRRSDGVEGAGARAGWAIVCAGVLAMVAGCTPGQNPPVGPAPPHPATAVAPPTPTPGRFSDPGRDTLAGRGAGAVGEGDRTSPD